MTINKSSFLIVSAYGIWPIRLEASPIEVIKILMANGVMASINQTVDFDTAAVVASELGFEPELEEIVEEAQRKRKKGEVPLWRRMIADEKEKDLKPRPPCYLDAGPCGPW